MNMLGLLITALLPSALTALELKASSQLETEYHLTAFQSYMATHKRSYAGTHEMQMRMALFRKRLEEVEAHNSKANRLWTAEMNHFSDRTEAELAQLSGWTPFMPPATTKAAQGSGAKQLDEHVQFPAQFLNWTKLESSRHFVRQGECGSCWAVASAGVLRAHSEIHRPFHRRSFSVQELLNCVPNPLHCGGSGKCGGATVELAFDWIDKHGVNIEEFAPYLSGMGVAGPCLSPGLTTLNRLTLRTQMDELFRPGRHEVSRSSPARAFGMTGWERLPENRYAPLLRAVMERGPVAVSVDATPWHRYMTGIMDSCRRNPILDHAAILYGWGEDKDVKAKFWNLQNSWGRWWGEGGHIRLIRFDDEERRCGVDTQPREGIGCEGGPDRVKVCGACGLLYDAVVPIFA